MNKQVCEGCEKGLPRIYENGEWLHTHDEEQEDETMTEEKSLVVKALELGRAYIQGIEGTIPLKPSLCTPDREKLEKAIRIAKHYERAVELLEDAEFDIDTAGIDLESVNRNIYRRAREILSAIDQEEKT